MKKLFTLWFEHGRTLAWAVDQESAAKIAQAITKYGKLEHVIEATR